MSEEIGYLGDEVSQEVKQSLIDIAGNPSTLLDFEHLIRLPEERLLAVRELQGVFLRGLGSSLGLALRCSAWGEVFKVEQTSYGKFADALSPPTCLAFLSAPGQEDRCALEVSAELVSSILDLLMGGDGEVETTRDRSVTEVEMDLLETPLGIISRELSEAWGRMIQGEFHLIGIRSNPRSTEFIGRSEPMVAITMGVTLGEKAGSLKLAVPESLLKLFRNERGLNVPGPANGTAETEERNLSHLRSRLMLDVDFELRGSSMRLLDLAGLMPDAVFDLGVACDGAIGVSVNGLPKFNGWLTQGEAKLAVTIE